VIRAKESSTDMYASIDLVADKLQRRVKKYHDKMQHKNLRHAAAKQVPPESEQAAMPGESAAGETVVTTDHGRVVKSKQFALKPMTVEEATLQLELVGHDFFMFTNADTSDTNVVYRRRDGQYGLIEPQRG
jgi:ribosome hibernation promoting factor